MLFTRMIMLHEQALCMAINLKFGKSILCLDSQELLALGMLMHTVSPAVPVMLNCYLMTAAGSKCDCRRASARRAVLSSRH